MNTMHRALLALPLLALTFTVACDAEESDSEFRAIPLNQIEQLDIGLQLFNESGDGDGTVIWDIKEVGVFEGDANEGAPLMLTISDDGQIFDAMGVHTCTLKAPYLDKKLIQVSAADSSEVLYTVYDNYILSGKIEPAKLTNGNIRRVLKSNLLFTFVDNEVYLGVPEGGKRLVSATDDLTLQDPNRKLLIGALIEGECGSNGLAGYAN